MKRTAKLAMDLLRFIGNSSSYRWHFQWAPSYSALMLTFLGETDACMAPFVLKLTRKAMFSFQIWRQYPNLINRAHLTASLGPVAAMLDGYPYMKNLSNLIQQISQSLRRQDISAADGSADMVASSPLAGDGAAVEYQDQQGEIDGFTFEGIEAFLAPNYFGDCFAAGQETS